MEHMAYNTITGEIIKCTTGNDLKRMVTWANKWSRIFGIAGNVWVFAHGKNCEEKIMKKVREI